MPGWFQYIPGLVFVTLCYAALCMASPVGTCRRCKGWGFKVHVSRWTGQLKRGRECRRCRGYGTRFRIGRRIYNHLARLHREGTR